MMSMHPNSDLKKATRAVLNFVFAALFTEMGNGQTSENRITQR